MLEIRFYYKSDFYGTSIVNSPYGDSDSGLKGDKITPSPMFHAVEASRGIYFIISRTIKPYYAPWGPMRGPMGPTWRPMGPRGTA